MDSLISNGAKLRSDGPRNGLLKLSIDGRLDADSTGRVWRESTRLVAAARAAEVDLDASAMDYCDGSGIALLIQLRRLQQKAGGKLEIHGLRPEFQELLDDWSHGSSDTGQSKAKVRVQLAEEVGRDAVQLWDDMREVISFIGQLGLAMVKAALHPSTVRWRDTLLVAEELGVNALPIVALLSFLVGVIMAFQAAVALRQFGAEIFVANMIGLSVLREMGPLMTAIILAGRSGSAFAAEIGTMKVREEIDALKTMGLEPVRFLVVPRVIAAVVMTPVLTVFAD
jgi:phospholipid/cholesterol/gamma-HCH transport system permease protein